nr:hypothetical protein [Pseudonocardia sp. ICBG601]
MSDPTGLSAPMRTAVDQVGGTAKPAVRNRSAGTLRSNGSRDSMRQARDAS